MQKSNTVIAGERTQNNFGLCPNCNQPLRYYDGCLGYEAARCDGCDYERDLNAGAPEGTQADSSIWLHRATELKAINAELLEACVRLINFGIAGGDTSWQSEDAQCCFYRMMKAIAKAEGK